MSWNTVMTFVEGEGEPAAHWPGTAFLGRCTFEEATSAASEGVAVSRAGGWTVRCHPPEWSPSPSGGLDAPSRTLTLIFGGTGDVYGFRLLRNGELIRERIVSEDEVVQEHGPPLPEEAGLPGADQGDQEERLFSLMEAVTGLTLADLSGVAFDLWSVPS